MKLLYVFKSARQFNAAIRAAVGENPLIGPAF
jgi:hypothetical protein